MLTAFVPHAATVGQSEKFAYVCRHASKISVSTVSRDDWQDITAQINNALQRSNLQEGIATVFIPHTTAAVTVQENADPPLKEDINQALARLFPRDGNYQHCEDNAASHMKAAMLGPSVQIPFSAGKLSLGTWQAVYLCEFDGPRQRHVALHVSGS